MTVDLSLLFADYKWFKASPRCSEVLVYFRVHGDITAGAVIGATHMKRSTREGGDTALVLKRTYYAFCGFLTFICCHDVGYLF